MNELQIQAPLAAQEGARLVEFARFCRAAARAVLLYPDGHPTIESSLTRIAQLTSSPALAAPLRIRVLANGLLLDGQPPARPDTAVSELAAQLHAHLIGELTVLPGGDEEAWRSFMRLLGRSPEAVRAEGGISHVWATTTKTHVELREIDYAEVLREREGGESAVWEQVVAFCLQGQAFELDEHAIRSLLELAGQPETLWELMSTVEARSADRGSGIGARTTALLHLLSGVVAAVRQEEPERIESTLQNMASALGNISPDIVVSFISRRESARGEEPGLVDAVVNRMSGGTIAHFVATNAPVDGSLDRVAQAFHALVRESEDQERILALAHDEAVRSPFGSTKGFEETWNQMAERLLTSYSDKPYVAEDYAHELSTARANAVDLARMCADPPDRMREWLDTVSTPELRRLDLSLVLDLLRLEDDVERREVVMQPVPALVFDLLLLGDFDAAADLVAAVTKDLQPGVSAPRRQPAARAVDTLVAGPLLDHVISHLADLDDEQGDRVRTMCVALGSALVTPLAEALAAEERPRARERLIAILVAFGAVGRREADRLKASANPTVRRTAIHLLREFGGSEAIPGLTGLLDDAEPQVQREAVRAVLTIGTDAAYEVLERALAGGTERSREVLMQAVGTMRDERAAPLFAYILQHIDHRGPLGGIYLRAVEALGTFKDPRGVVALRDALYRGEWWAPRRTGAIRRTAAAALARIGTSEAVAVLSEASDSGPRGVRAAARAHQRPAGR